MMQNPEQLLKKYGHMKLSELMEALEVAEHALDYVWRFVTDMDPEHEWHPSVRQAISIGLVAVRGQHVSVSLDPEEPCGK